MKKAILKHLVGLVCIGLAFSASATTWTYTGYTTKTDGYTGGTITDGQWTLTVSSFETDVASIGLTTVSGWQTPSETSLSGILDLRSPSVVVGERTIELKTIRFAESAFSKNNQDKTHTVSAFYCDIIKSFGDNIFSWSTALKEVYLAGTIDALQTNAFNAGYSNNGTITNIVLDLPNLSSVASDAFQYQSNISRVELVSAFSDMSLITNVVRYANNKKNNTDVPVIGKLCIYVSEKQRKPSEKETYDASSNLTGFFADKSTITDTEKKSIDEETLKNVIGVLVKDGTRKGIFVHKASKYDKPSGFAISVR